LKSRPFDDIKSEILMLQDINEIVLSSIELALWGYDFGLDIVWLLKEIGKLLHNKNAKIRLGSIYPALLLNKEFVTLMTTTDILQPHLHLSLQSASPEVLKSMRRFTNVDKILEKIFEIKDSRPDFLVSTDIIVGYPIESDRDFQLTVDFLEQLPLVKVHSFPFSPRKGTKAAELKPLEKKVVLERQKLIIERFSQSQILKSFINNNIPDPLWEREDENWLYGHSSNYIPIKLDKRVSKKFLRGKSVDKNYLILE
jgi:threonylcarbamoyladenosine tRNA methylthiotransferase MtaB